MTANEKKQINALTKDIYSMLRSDAMSRAMASMLYGEGYRKSADVAREIFEEIAKILCRYDKLAEKDGSEYGELIIMDIGCAISELKKKYTEDTK